MHSETDNPISCEIHAVIHFLGSKNTSALEIHHELCAATCSENAMVKELYNNGVECSKIGEQMFTMKSEAVSHL
jgi:hypothetical protein